jgi:hypothetical protein
MISTMLSDSASPPAAFSPSSTPVPVPEAPSVDASQGRAVAADPAQIGRFVRALFRHAGEGGTVSLRAFHDDQPGGSYKTRGVRLNGGGLDPVIRGAISLAEDAAQEGRPVVVCPPVATFSGDKADEEWRRRAGSSPGRQPVGP